MSKGKVILRDFDAGRQRVLAAVSGRVVQNMERACQFVEAEAKANAPVSQRSGVRHMRDEITHEVSARRNVITGTVGVRARAYWAWFIERGTRKMAAQPFLRPAVFNNSARIVRIVAGEE